MNNKPLWPLNKSKANQRRNVIWEYKYLISIFLSQNLSNYGSRGSNFCETTHRAVESRSPSITDHTIGLSKFIDSEMCNRFRIYYDRINKLHIEHSYDKLVQEQCPKLWLDMLHDVLDSGVDLRGIFDLAGMY